MQNKKQARPYALLAGVVLFGLGFALAAGQDMNLAEKLYSPHNLFAVLMEVFGWMVAYMPLLHYGLLLLTRPRGSRLPLWANIGIGAVLVAVLGVVYYVCFGYLLKRGMAAPGVDTWLWFAAGLVFAGFLVALTVFVKPERRPLYEFINACGVVVLAGNLAVVNALKFLWQRARFDEMLAVNQLGQFTPWYLPQGAGGSSFPSGHTANAASVLLLVVACDVLGASRAQRLATYIVAWGYIASMGLSRMIIGRHFLSDVLAGAGLVALMVFALRRTPAYRRGLARLQQADDNKKTAEEE